MVGKEWRLVASWLLVLHLHITVKQEVKLKQEAGANYEPEGLNQ